MPIYQYQCTECGHGLEALQKMSDPKLVDCPSCNKSTLKKQVTAAAFKLKGTGWYETDFKNSGKKPDAVASSSDAKPGTDKTGGQTKPSSSESKATGAVE